MIDFTVTVPKTPSIVSIYPKITETKKCEYIDFHELMEIQRTDHWKKPIDEIRAMIKAGASEDAISKKKKNLPYFTGSGSFKERNDAGLIQHIGKIVLDFDKLDELDQAREKLINDKYTEYLAVSCTGRGLLVIVDIDPNKHLESFLFLEKYYLNTYGLQVDKSCKDISRPRFITYDPDLFHNPNSETVEIQYATTTVDTDEEKYEWIISAHNKKLAFVEGNRHHYLVVLAFFCNKYGVSESYVLNRLIRDFSGPDKTQKEITQIVTYCYKNTVDFGTKVINKKVKDLPPEFSGAVKSIYSFAHSVNRAGRVFSDLDIKSMCGQHYLAEDIVRGIFQNVADNNQDEFGLDDQPEIYKIEHYIKKRWDILRNEVTKRLEARPARTNNPYALCNSDTILRDLTHAGFKTTLDKLKSLLRSDFVKSYNPFFQYFESLPEYDGVDHIADLASYMKTDDQEFFVEQFKKALVRNIACSLYGYNNRIIFVLAGQDQEKGKSTWIRFLCPPALMEYYTESGLDSSKDSELQLSENFIWNLEELAGMENYEVNKLKSTISKASVKQRRAFAEFHESNPRRVNFWASTNKTDFLTDNQNTRWLCFNVLDVNFDYHNTETGVKKINIDDVWAQAWALYHSGFNFRMTTAEAKKRDQINKQFEKGSMEKDLIQKYYKPCEPKRGDFMTSTEVLMHLSEFTDHKHKLNIVAVGRALSQLGFNDGQIKRSGCPIRGWWTQKNANTVLLDFDTQEASTPKFTIEDENPEKKPF